MANQWIVTPRANPYAQVRFVCVPDAGGGVSSFRGWSERLGAAEVGVVQLPGRENRLREPALESLSEAADGVSHAITTTRPAPTVLFGHSLGALIAFETARRLRDRGWPLLALFVSGKCAPALPDSRPQLSKLPGDEFVTELRRRYEAIPAAVLADSDLMQLLLPGLRADFAMHDTYRYQPGTPLACPIVACGGTVDPYASRSDLEAWRRETEGRFSAHQFGGGHFYLQREQAAVTTLIANQLSVMVSAMARWAAAR